MKNLLIFGFFLMAALATTSCLQRDKSHTTSHTSTVKVVDTHGKPIPNQKVGLYISISNYYHGFDDLFFKHNAAQQELTTDKEGNVVFTYNLTIDSYNQDFAHFLAKDNDTWKLVLADTHTLGESNKKNFEVKMDSSVSLKIRLSTSSKDLINYVVRTKSSFENKPSSFDREERHLDISRNAATIDTSFTIKVLSKQDLTLIVHTTFKPKINITDVTYFTENMRRDSTYWIKF